MKNTNDGRTKSRVPTRGDPNIGRCQKDSHTRKGLTKIIQPITLSKQLNKELVEISLIWVFTQRIDENIGQKRKNDDIDLKC